MATVGAVGVHVGDEVEVGGVEQALQLRVLALLEALDDAFHEPFGHVLAGVLLGDDPDAALGLGVAADLEQGDVAPFEALAGGDDLGAGRFDGLADEGVVARAAVGLEIGEPDVRLGGLQAEVQAVLVEVAGHAEPVDLVIGGGGVVAGPGVGVGGLAGVDQAEVMAAAGVMPSTLKWNHWKWWLRRSGRMARRTWRGLLASLTSMLPLSKSALIFMATSGCVRGARKNGRSPGAGICTRRQRLA